MVKEGGVIMNEFATCPKCKKNTLNEGNPGVWYCIPCQHKKIDIIFGDVDDL